MTNIDRIAETLVKEGYLSRENIEPAITILAQFLSAADRDKYREVEADSRFQEQMILKDEPYEEQDVARGDSKSLKVDQAILQDAFNQDEADLARLQALDSKISKQAKKAAKAMVSAGLIAKQTQKLTTELIRRVWISE